MPKPFFYPPTDQMATDNCLPPAYGQPLPDKGIGPMKPERVMHLLGTDHITGSQAAREALCTRIGELAAMNGDAWVRRHRLRLLRQWETLLESGVFASSPKNETAD